MSGVCPTNCTDFDNTPILSAQCLKELREWNVKAIGFYKCDVVLPSELTCANLEPLMTGNNPSLVFSGALANVTLSEPTTASRKLDDCTPDIEVIESREITFQDRIKVDINQAGDASPFYDYQFWKNKKEHQARLNYVIVMCDGSLIVPRNKNSLHGMSATFSMFINFEDKTEGGKIEFKQGKIKFLGDPFDFVVPNLNLSDCANLNGLW